MRIHRSHSQTSFRPKAATAALALLAITPSLRGQDNPHGKEIPDAPLPAKVDYNRDIRPFLSAKCWHCHGPDEEGRKADLRLDLREEAIRDLGGYQAVKPGVPDASEVMKRITTTDRKEVMPPPKEGHPLTAREIELMRRWIAAGADYALHWAFIPPRRPALPANARPDSSPIDAFVEAKLKEHRLTMSPAADKHTLIRRVALDLTGLPPTPAEVAAFVDDSSPQAFERMVDRYLASTAYGERWARMWLDIARYADSAGYGSDPLRLNIWPYRDWVINAFNRNLPYDEFTLEQLAGDLLPHPTNDQLVATAFHRNTMTNTEGGTDDEEFRVAAVKDRVGVTIQAWMGLTMNCAQCHTHKFDPITQKEYYQFYAIFNQTEDSDKPDDFPTMPLPTAAERSRMQALESEIADLEKQMTAPSSVELEKELADWERAVRKPVHWTVLKPESATARAKGSEVEIGADGSVAVLGNNPPSDVLTIKTRTTLKGITAFRLEALADARLPSKGPGRADNGNAVLNEFAVTAAAVPANSTRGRFVRIENPGKQKMIHLAEVQVFVGGKNIAPQGKATQTGMYADAAAQRAIDGKTDGDYKKGSVNHTAVTDDPWWEVDLGAEQPLEKIVLWNRTDGGTASRLNGAVLSVLDAQRKTRFSRAIPKAPEKNLAFAVSNSTQVTFRTATADFAQSGFDPMRAIDGSKDTGWAIGGAAGTDHAIAFETAAATGDGRETELTFTLSTGAVDRHNLGKVRLLATTQAQPVQEVPLALKAILDKPAASRTSAERGQLLAYFRPQSKLFASIQSRLNARKAELAGIKPMSVPVLKELAADKHRETHFLNKGNFLDPGEVVQPGLLKAFHAVPSEKSLTRLSVARWLMSRDNPLTARVAVNRFWAQLFGTGIVETEEDFGTQGSLPSHPELLDWLAIEFMDRGWDIKRLLKTIVLSETYRQSSKASPELLKTDPRNVLLSRYPRRRLDAEQVRDQALALSGLLSPKMGGPSVFPPQPEGLWRAAFNGQRSWDTSKGEDRYRRGLYTFWRRTVPYPSMATFDAPSRENCTLRRTPTNTPLHAFVTLNDPAFFECAQALGRRLLREGGATAESRAKFGLELVLARPASPEQVRTLVALAQQQLAAYGTDQTAATKLAGSPTELDKLNPAEAAAWTVVANVLLNLDGVLTKG